MRTIYKYNLDLQETQEKSMPAGAIALSVQMQDGDLCLWALVDTSSKSQLRRVWIRGTGTDCVGMCKQEYIGSVQDGPYIWHVFLQEY